MGYNVDAENQKVRFDIEVSFSTLLDMYSCYLPGGKQKVMELTEKEKLEILDRIAGDFNSAADYFMNRCAQEVAVDEDTELDDDEIEDEEDY